MEVPLQDLQTRSALLEPEYLAGIRRVLASGSFILGDSVELFESEWSSALLVDHTVGVANGMDAIEIGLRCLGIGPGDEVVTTSVTAAATALAIVRAGARPVFASVNPCTGLIDMASVERCLTRRTRALLLVHLYGYARDVQSWSSFCIQNGISLIEDCAQAHLAKSGGRFAGSFGDFGAFSFYPTKNLGAIGDAGAIVTNSKSLAVTARQVRNYGQSGRYEHVGLGLNSRLDEIQATLLSVGLKHLPLWTTQRQTVAAFYRNHIANPRVELLASPQDNSEHVYHQFVVRVSERTSFRQFLGDNGIQTDVHYPKSLDLQPVFREFARDPSGLSDTHAFTKTCVSLPCFPEISHDQASKVVEIVNRWNP